MMEDCIFCKIAIGQIDSRVIYEDDAVLAFLDITPFTKGHTLLIPKEHYRWVWDMPEELTSHFYTTGNKIAKQFQSLSKGDIVYSLTSGLLVDHCHLHIIPNTSDKFGNELSETLSRSRMTLNDDQFDKIYDQFKLESSQV